MNNQMKIQVIIDGQPRQVDAEQIVINNLTLKQVLERIDKLESDFLELKRKTAIREREITELVKAL